MCVSVALMLYWWCFGSVFLGGGGVMRRPTRCFLSRVRSVRRTTVVVAEMEGGLYMFFLRFASAGIY